MQRVTSIALVPLVLWCVISLLGELRADYQTLQHWLSNPVNAGLMVTFLFTVFYHAKLGMQVIYEDYVRPEWAMYVALLVTQFVLFLLGAISIISVLKIALA